MGLLLLGTGKIIEIEQNDLHVVGYIPWLLRIITGIVYVGGQARNSTYKE